MKPANILLTSSGNIKLADLGLARNVDVSGASTQSRSKGAAGTFGPLDPQRLVFHGWSGGASMVSWMFQQQMAGWEGLANIGVKAGIFLSGGSHDCYEDTPATLQRTVSVCQVVSGHPDLRAHFGG